MSDAMKVLQAKVGVTADGAFGPNTARAIAKHYKLSPARAAHLLAQPPDRQQHARYQRMPRDPRQDRGQHRYLPAIDLQMWRQGSLYPLCVGHGRSSRLAARQEGQRPAVVRYSE